MDTQCFLSTVDNPYDPYEQFDLWFLFDIEKGYNCCGMLDRLAQVTDDMSEEEVEQAKEQAIDNIIKYDFTNTYIKVVKQVASA